MVFGGYFNGAYWWLLIDIILVVMDTCILTKSQGLE
jgi:hypothetical protein